MQNFTPGQLAALRQQFLEQVAGAVPLSFLDVSDFVSSELFDAIAGSFLRTTQASAFATAAQGAKADTALQPGSNLTNNIGGVPAENLVADSAQALSLAQTAYGWGNHAAAGYLTSAPKLRLYQATAAGASPETFTLPQAPVSGSSVIVLIAASGKHYTVTDPPPTGNEFYWDGGTTVKANTTLGDLVSIYYEA